MDGFQTDLFDIKYLTKEDFDKYKDLHKDSIWEGEGFYNLDSAESDSLCCFGWETIIIPLAKRIKEVESMLSDYAAELESVKKTYSKTLKETEIREKLRCARLEVSKLEQELEKLNG